MILCNRADLDYKRACFDAHNRWLAGYREHRPHRLLGLGHIAMCTPDGGIRDMRAMKALGWRSVMMSGEPGVEDYDSPIYDDFWAAPVELGMPPSFRILTMRCHFGVHRLRQSMSPPTMSTTVARHSAAWRCRDRRSVLRRSCP